MMLVDLTGYLFFDSLQQEVYWFFLGQCYTWYGAGGGGFNLLDNVPNLGVFFLKASLRGLGWEQKIILSLSHND